MLGGLLRFPVEYIKAPEHIGFVNFLTRTPARGGACQALGLGTFKLALLGSLPLIVTDYA